MYIYQTVLAAISIVLMVLSAIIFLSKKESFIFGFPSSHFIRRYRQFGANFNPIFSLSLVGLSFGFIFQAIAGWENTLCENDARSAHPWDPVCTVSLLTANQFSLMWY